MNCRECPKYQGCREICEELAQELDQVTKGSIDYFFRHRHLTYRELHENMRLASEVSCRISELPVKEREIIILFYEEQLDIFEIAERKGLTYHAVRGLIKRAYTFVRKAIENES